MIGTLYVRCTHLTVSEQQVLQRGMRYQIISEYDWCPICTREIEAKQRKVQTSFDAVFGDSKDES